MLCMTMKVCSLVQSWDIHSKQEYIGEKIPQNTPEVA